MLAFADGTCVLPPGDQSDCVSRGSKGSAEVQAARDASAKPETAAEARETSEQPAVGDDSARCHDGGDHVGDALTPVVRHGRGDDGASAPLMHRPIADAMSSRGLS